MRLSQWSTTAALTKLNEHVVKAITPPDQIYGRHV